MLAILEQPRQLFADPSCKNHSTQSADLTVEEVGEVLRPALSSENCASLSMSPSLSEAQESLKGKITIFQTQKQPPGMCEVIHNRQNIPSTRQGTDVP